MPDTQAIVTAAQYHADQVADTPTLSASITNVLLNKSPLHAWTQHPRLNPDHQPSDDEKFDIGTCAHALLLEGISRVSVVAADSWRTQAAKDLRQEARTAGLIPLLVAQAEEVHLMVDAAHRQLANLDIDPKPFTDGEPEVTLVWDEAGVACRSRLDWLRHDHTLINDYKTTSRSANPESWQKTLFSMGYDVQAAFYLRAVAAVHGVAADWQWVVQETVPPYALSVIAPGPDVLALADAKVDHALGLWRRSVESGVWDGYPRRVATVELPGWAESQWLEREARETV